MLAPPPRAPRVGRKSFGCDTLRCDRGGWVRPIPRAPLGRRFGSSCNVLLLASRYEQFPPFLVTVAMVACCERGLRREHPSRERYQKCEARMSSKTRPRKVQSEQGGRARGGAVRRSGGGQPRARDRPLPRRRATGRLRSSAAACRSGRRPADACPGLSPSGWN